MSLLDKLFQTGQAEELATTGTPVDVSAAAPPTVGQILTATDATHATWQDPSGSGIGNFSGPSGATTGNIVTFASTTGHLGQDSGIAASTIVPNTRNINAGTGLSGGGNLTADRTLTVTSTPALQTTGSPVNVSAAAPGSVGQVLTLTDATHGTWQTPAASGSAGGDLSGSYPNPTVTQARGLKGATTTVSVSAASTPSTGQVLTATSSTTASWHTPASSSPTGSAGGDLGGTYPNPTVVAIESATTSINVGSATAPSTGQVLTATSSIAATWQTPASGVALTSSAPVNVTAAAAAVGTATDAARSDHKHNISTAAPSSLTVGGSNVAGSATSLALSDHTHGLPAFGSTSGTFAQGNDSRLSDDRTGSGLRSATTVVAVSSATAPATGQVLTATSSTAATWQTPASGVALTSNAPANVTASAAAVGTGTAAARDDHKHNISTGTPTALTVGGSNTAGSATSLALSDHVHGLPAFGSTSGTFAQGNDSRLSDDRTGSGLRTASTVVSVSSATAPTTGQVLTATSSTAATWQTPAAGGVVTPTNFTWSSNAASISVASGGDFVATNTMGGNSTLTLTSGVDGVQGTIYVKQDATGSRTLTFSITGRTILRDANSTDDNPESSASSLTVYSYQYITVVSTAYVRITKVFL